MIQTPTKPNGVHHLAISTADIKGQLAFFTDVLGGELSKSKDEPSTSVKAFIQEAIQLS